MNNGNGNGAHPNGGALRVPHALTLGFDFYGDGNIGDDLMIAGFLRALEIVSKDPLPALSGFSRGALESQQRRFPQIHWSNARGAGRLNGAGPEHVDCWAGVGGTPLQLTSGDWFLRYLQQRTDEITSFRQRLLIGIGAEQEIRPRAAEFAQLLANFDRIATRDVQSAELVSSLPGIGADRVYAGSDLAHVALSELFPQRDTSPRPYALGLMVTGETLNGADVEELRVFLSRRKDRVALLANEIRTLPHFELGIYSRLGHFPWSGARRRSIQLIPPYRQGNLDELVRPIAQCETVISSRYHGILTAAWAGCRVAALGRSSKIVALADELGIPCRPFPLRKEDLTALEQEAVAIPEAQLFEMRERALQGVAYVFSDHSA